MLVDDEPYWWECDKPWLLVRNAFRRDWEKIREVLGGDGPEEDLWISDMSSTETGAQPICAHDMPEFEEVEPAYVFGYIARRHYGQQFPMWTAAMEARLEKEWQLTHPNAPYSWSRFWLAVRRGWDYQAVERQVLGGLGVGARRN